MNHEDAGPERDPDDDSLLARLGEVLRRQDPAPEIAVELAKQSFGLRTVDAELAALVADSDVDALAVAVRRDGARDGPRLLTFETQPSAAGDITAVEVEISGPGRDRRMLGQLHPPGPARVELRQPSAGDPRWVDADDQGRFVIDGMRAGPFNLTCHRPGKRPVTTAWTGPD